jgi:hypothetical protein
MFYWDCKNQTTRNSTVILGPETDYRSVDLCKRRNCFSCEAEGDGSLHGVAKHQKCHAEVLDIELAASFVALYFVTNTSSLL